MRFVYCNGHNSTSPFSGSPGKKEMRASGLAELAKVLQTTPNYLLGFADNNDGFADEALGLLRDVKDQSVREILLKQIRALI